MSVNIWAEVGATTYTLVMEALYGTSNQLLGMNTGATALQYKDATFNNTTDQLAVPVGSAAAPSYTFTGDLDSGFYQDGADALGLAVGGSKVVGLSASTLTSLVNVVLSGKLVQEDKGADITAATTTDLGTATGNYVVVTNAAGATAITGLGGATVPAGTTIETKFSISGGSVVLTHNATSMILLGAANITLVNGDIVRWRKINDAAAYWEMVGFQRGISNTTLAKIGDIVVGTGSSPNSAVSTLGAGTILNAVCTASVAAPALTIALKTQAGIDASPSEPVIVAFPNVTPASAAYTLRSVTTALSLTISSGSTLGHANGQTCTLFVYLIDNAGTVELAVSSLPPDYAGTFADTRLISTTAEGGAGGADSATGIYSTTARSNVPWICVAMITSTQATAGTWATAMAQVDQGPITIPKYAFSVYRTTSQNVANITATKYAPDTESYDLGGAYDLSGNNRFNCRVSGPHTFNFQTRPENPDTAVVTYTNIYVNGAQVANSGLVAYGTAAAGSTTRTARTLNLKTGDYVEAYIYHNRGTSEDFTATPIITYFCGERV